MQDNITTQPFAPDLQAQLPRIAQFLGTEPEKLFVINHEMWENDYMQSDWRDRVVGTEGSLNELPFVNMNRSQSTTRGYLGFGIAYYECRIDPSIRYAVSYLQSNYERESYLVVEKSKLFRLRRNVARLNSESSKICEQPILPDGLLEEIVRDTVGFILSSKKIEGYGVKIRRGLILDGKPGNGKTLICRHIQKLCSQRGIDWGVVSASEIEEAFARKTLNFLFSDHTVTFFDDIDIAYLNRAKNNGKIACSLLSAMDGMTQGKHLVRIFTTNEPIGELDEAFVRPGRIDKCITLENPTADLRAKLIETVWPAELRKNVDVNELVKKSENFSFAELEAIRTFLVTHRVIGDGKWDLDRAFKDFSERNSGPKKRKSKTVGFS
jgi:hypothetical protein